MSRCVAAIDIGTNSVLMQIGRRRDDGSHEVVEDRVRVTRLGRGVDARRRLSTAAIQRTLDALGEYATQARALNAELLAVGTSALRDVEDAERFLEPAAALLGRPVEIISGEREAALSFAGAAVGLGLEASRRCVVDVGGGSTELVTGAAQVEHACSLELGCVRLSERLGLTAPAGERQLTALREVIRRTLMDSPVRPRAPLIAVAGTATSLSAIDQALEPYDPARIHGARLTRRRMEQLLSELAAMDGYALQRVPGLTADRTDVIVAGAALLVEISTLAGAHEVIVSNGGIRAGLVQEWLNSESPDGPPS